MDTALTARRNMVDSQIRPNDVTDPRIVSAFMAVPREVFVPRSRESIAYSELEIETSPGRALWTPRDFAKMVEALDPREDEVALVIGAGAGYECAVLNNLCATVIGLEEDTDLVASTSRRLTAYGFDRVACVEGKLAEGLPGEGPFDVILVNGMVETVPPAWALQLSPHGRLGVVASEGRVGRARIYTRVGDAVSYRTSFDASPPKLAQFDAVRGFRF